jgi:glycerophosphoryl diester phosphodiesterase
MGEVLVRAHRGSPLEEKEKTIQSFLLAEGHGALGAEETLKALKAETELNLEKKTTHRTHPTTRVTPRGIRAERDAGREVNAWAVDYCFLAKPLARWGESGIITNRSAELLAAFREGSDYCSVQSRS